MRDNVVARVLFTDGIWREVYQQPDLWQYVFDQAGKRFLRVVHPRLRRSSGTNGGC